MSARFNTASTRNSSSLPTVGGINRPESSRSSRMTTRYQYVHVRPTAAIPGRSRLSSSNCENSATINMKRKVGARKRSNRPLYSLTTRPPMADRWLGTDRRLTAPRHRRTASPLCPLLAPTNKRNDRPRNNVGHEEQKQHGGRTQGNKCKNQNT